MDSKRYVNPIVKIGAIVGAVLLAVVLVLSIVRIVPEGHVGVVYSFGKLKEGVVGAGPNYKLPIVEKIEIIDIRERLYESETSAYTKDTQTVENVICSLTYSYNSSELFNIIRNTGIKNIESKVVVPQVNSILKNIIGKYKAEELVQSRAAIQEVVEQELREKFALNGLNVNSFDIKNIDFEDSFEEVIRAKVAAEQEALRKKNETDTKREEAEQVVIAAKADAEAKMLEADAEAYAIKAIQEQLSTSPNYNELQLIQKWNGEWPQIMGNSINPFVSLGTETK